jgi:hypothetical protein
MHLASVCRACQEDARDRRKGGDREAAKASDARRGHAIKLSRPRRGSGVEAWHDPNLAASELEVVYGWDLPQMAHDIEYQYGNGCSYCHHSYKGMGHGLADITIDIFDPRLPPDYGTNTRWCCMTCQRRKGLLPPEKWAIKQRIYRKWETAKTMSAEARGMLFDVA